MLKGIKLNSPENQLVLHCPHFIVLALKMRQEILFYEQTWAVHIGVGKLRGDLTETLKDVRGLERIDYEMLSLSARYQDPQANISEQGLAHVGQMAISSL